MIQFDWMKRRGMPIFRHIASAQDMVLLLPMQHDRQNKNTLRYFCDSLKGKKSRFSLIFYQTPNTIHNFVSNQSIEVFVVSLYVVAHKRRIFGIDKQGDIHSQLNSTNNLAGEIFEPAKKTFLIVTYNEVMRNVSNIVNRTDVMMDSQNIFMANVIVRNMKNLPTMQVVLSEIGANKNFFIYTPSNRPIYAELFVSTMDYRYKKEKYTEM